MSDVSNNLTKWHYAIILGAPIVIGIGGYYYFRNRDPIRKEETKSIDSKADSLEGLFGYDKATALKVQGNKFFKERKYEEAIKCYSDAITECPADKDKGLAVFYQNRAASYEMLGKFENVVSDCSKAVQLDKQYIKALCRRSKAYESLGQLQDSLNDITAVCILEQFKNNETLVITDKILRKQSKIKAKASVGSPRVPTKNLIRQYFLSFSRDPLMKNINLKDDFDFFSLSFDDDASKLLHDATKFILRGDNSNAYDRLNQLLILNQCEIDAKVNALIKLGTLKMQETNENDEKNSEALKYFDDAVKLDPNNPDSYLHRAQLLLMSERAEEARKDLEKCCQLDETFSSALAHKLYVQFRCGLRYNDQNATQKSLDGFESAVEKFKTSSEIHSLYAQALMECQEFEKADNYFKKAIAIDENDGNLLVHRGILQIQWKNDVDETIKLLEKAIQVDPSCQFAYEMIGSIEVQRGNITEGLKHFEKALELAHTELDRAHLYSLRDAAEAQLKAIQLLGFELPNN